MRAAFLESTLEPEQTFGKLADENYLLGLGVDTFADRAAYYPGELNAAHPFHEGNGRTQREFIRQLGLRFASEMK